MKVLWLWFINVGLITHFISLFVYPSVTAVLAQHADERGRDRWSSFLNCAALRFNRVYIWSMLALLVYMLLQIAYYYLVSNNLLTLYYSVLIIGCSLFFVCNLLFFSRECFSAYKKFKRSDE